jgi:hypothetical protein
MTDNCKACGDPAAFRLHIPPGSDGALTLRIARILKVAVGSMICRRCWTNALTMIQLQNAGVMERIEVAM